MAGSEKLYPLSTNYQAGQFATGYGTTDYGFAFGQNHVEWASKTGTSPYVQFDVDFSKYYKIDVSIWVNNYYQFSNMERINCGNYNWYCSTRANGWDTNTKYTVSLTPANTGISDTGVCRIYTNRASNNYGNVQCRLYNVTGYYYEVGADVVPSGSGSVSGTGHYGITTTSLLATPISAYDFDYWELSGTTYNDNPLSINVTGDVTYTANFVFAYNITLNYDSNLGSASYTLIGGTSQIDLEATPHPSCQFVGWYVNSVKISGNASYTYTVLADTVIEARFEPIHAVADDVDGQGAISYTRGTDQNDVTFTVIPSANWHFVKYVVNGTDEYTTTPLSLHLTDDTSITAYFEEDDKFTISTSTNIEYASIYVSANEVYSGTTVTLYARPMADYYFVRWEDGAEENPRQITVTENVLMVAIYQRMPDDPNIHLYRCYIKDQLNMTDPPKAFLKVDSFTVKTDLMTNANSTIRVFEMASNVNNGDVLVLYDPHGTTLYQGVVKSISDNNITCSQMQSFYKGDWVYNVHSSSATLEEEVAYLLGEYASGKMYGSSYTDPLVAQRLGGITIQQEANTSANLPTDDVYKVKDFEKFIYSLYEDYGIILDFDIAFSGTNYVTIKVPDYETVKVGNNMYAIKNMSPITSIEETNRLVIYAKDNTYRTTYVATTNGIVEAPSSTANRFNITNSKIVFSDDPVADLVSANLPDNMFNHKLTFTLVIKNFIYEFGDFNLGGSLDVWHYDDYYSTVLTGYEIKKASRQNITEVDFTCGLVRTALTKLMTLGRV